MSAETFEERAGVFCPLTLSTKLAVDGIVCSAYTASNPPEKFIPATAPVRQLYKTAGVRAVQSLSDRIWDLKTSRPKFLSPKPRRFTAPKFIRDNTGAIRVAV